MSDPLPPIALSDMVPVMDPSLLSVVCAVPVDARLRQAIAGSGRIRSRIAARAAENLDLPKQADRPAQDHPTAPAVERLASEGMAGIDDFLHLAAGLAAAQTIRRMVTREDVARLRSALGDDIYLRVLSSEAGEPQDAPAPATQAAARVAGLACLGDWLTAMPKPLAALLTLRFDASDRETLAELGQAGGRHAVDAAAALLCEPADKPRQDAAHA